jgi:hypothetical protein
MASFNLRDVMIVAGKLDRRLPRLELKALCDAQTDYQCNAWQLDRMMERVERYPSYQSLPPLEEDE